MPNMPTSKMDCTEAERSPLDDMRMFVERLALRAGIRTTDDEGRCETWNSSNADEVRILQSTDRMQIGCMLRHYNATDILP